MIHNKIKVLSLTACMFLIVGCGGDGKNGIVSDESLLITVPDNISPKAVIGSKTTRVTQGRNIVLDASQSSDSDGTISKYQWQLLDGTVLGEGETLTYNTAKLKAGTYVIRLIVTDDSGATAIDKITIKVLKKPKPAPVTASTPMSTPTPTPTPTPDDNDTTTCQDVNPVTGECED